MTDAGPDGPKYMDIEQLADMLVMPKASVYKLVAARRIPGQKVGKHWRFVRDEVDHWLRHGRTSAGVTPESAKSLASPPVPPVVVESRGMGASRGQASVPAGPAPARPVSETTAARPTADRPGTPPVSWGPFTPRQTEILRQNWIRTPRQFLAQAELADDRRRLAELLEVSDDQLFDMALRVAALAAAGAGGD